METIYYGHVPLARDRRTSKGCPGVVLRATRGTAIISLTLIYSAVLKSVYRMVLGEVLILNELVDGLRKP